MEQYLKVFNQFVTRQNRHKISHNPHFKKLEKKTKRVFSSTTQSALAHFKSRVSSCLLKLYSQFHFHKRKQEFPSLSKATLTLIWEVTPWCKDFFSILCYKSCKTRKAVLKQISVNYSSLIHWTAFIITPSRATITFLLSSKSNETFLYTHDKKTWRLSLWKNLCVRCFL